MATRKSTFPKSVNYELTNEATYESCSTAYEANEADTLHTKLLQGTEDEKLETRSVLRAFQLGFVMTSYSTDKNHNCSLFSFTTLKMPKTKLSEPQLLSRVWHTGHPIDPCSNTKK